MGFFGVLAIVFITLKLIGTIDWSWLLVLAPIWGPACVALVVIAGWFGVKGGAALVSKMKGGKR